MTVPLKYPDFGKLADRLENACDGSQLCEN
jgi:hypothetical protein